MASFADESSSDNFASQLTDGIIWGHSIPFSIKPIHHECYLPDLVDEYGSLGDVINYSELYRDFVIDNNSTSKDVFTKLLIPPSKIHTGDILQNGDYRGVGNYYAVWLHADVFHNPSSLSLSRVSLPSPEHSRGTTETNDEEDEIDLNVYNLNAELVANIKKLANSYFGTHDVEGLTSLLQSEYPDLLEKLLKEETRYDYEAAIHELKFEGFTDASEGEQIEWDELDPEEIIQNGQTTEASQYFSGIPRMNFPLLRKPKYLAETIESRPWMQLYLFAHHDEMGYSAPTAVSLAPYGYYETEFHERHIDLALLPSPLDRNTTFGFVLTHLQSRFPESEKTDSSNPGDEEGDEDEDEGDDEDEDEDEEEEEEERKVAPVSNNLHSRVRDLAMVDFEAEDAIFWFSIANTSYYVDWKKDFENPLLVTRRMYQNHASFIRQKLLELHPSTSPVTDEELKSLFHQLLFA